MKLGKNARGEEKSQNKYDRNNEKKKETGKRKCA